MKKAFTTLALFTVPCIAAPCHAPKYRQGFAWEDSPSSIMTNINVNARDLTPDSLVCLAAELRRHYAGRKKIVILIFDTDEAAKRYTSPNLGEPTRPVINWATQNHASYSFDAVRGQEYVEIYPLGTASSPVSSGTVNTRINLPVVDVPTCTLNVGGRCLMALNRVDYPWEDLKASVAGTVTIKGWIARNGLVRKSQIVSAEVRPDDAARMLVNAVKQSIGTWHFAASPHTDSFQITYLYKIESLGSPGQMSVKFELPHHITISGTPPR